MMLKIKIIIDWKKSFFLSQEEKKKPRGSNTVMNNIKNINIKSDKGEKGERTSYTFYMYICGTVSMVWIPT